jgi:hypothetical protein
MKFATVIICFLLCINCLAQHQPKNIFIVTTDGFRWEEVFNGADSSLISNAAFVKDTLLAKQMFWDNNMAARRQKLMPFLWNVIAKQGQLYGNRLYGNNVNVKNFYKISYPGYNEIFTGYADLKPMLNFAVQNKNTNVLEYLNKQASFKGKVVAFSSWNLMPFIINEKRSGFAVNSGYEMLEDTNETSNLIDTVQKYTAVKGHTRNDELTYLSAKEYVAQNHPKAVFLGLGETDEAAHCGNYDTYLQKAAAVDKMIADLWYFIQTDSFYKNNTTLIITTDHGRGKNGAAWKGHGFWVKGSGEVWLAMLGPSISAEGEIKTAQQIWQKQIASTIAQLVGENFEADHKIADAINIPSINKAATKIVLVKNE